MGSTLPSKSLIPSESSQQTNPTFYQKSCAENCPQTRPSIVFRGCSLTLALTQSRAHLTTCHFPQHCTESQTCRSCHASLSPVPPDPRLLLTYFHTSSPKHSTVPDHDCNPSQTMTLTPC